ncbi:MAG: tRNA 2-thiouridine(34) synthase MnmA [Flavobacteriales bacterium]|nr:tRNA 2-thiouridine(34) synthase MnmA [Flavobacteriales bacterium]
MRVVIGLSGGVDSSVAAYLLQKQGHEVIGLFMRNWHDESVIIDNACPWIDDANDAVMVAEHLGIPFQVLDLSDAYRERIVNYMFDEYAAGRTPNPDILCNREIKFDLFLDAAKNIGAEAIATGHYCQKETLDTRKGEIHRLIAGADPNKDQSYFLCQLNQDQLQQALFPIGHMLKPDVRALAEEIGLPTAQKKDSQGLCFIGKVRLPEFLQQQLEVKPGDIIEIEGSHPMFAARRALSADSPRIDSHPYSFSPDQGKVVGRHQGAHFFTVGQRKGLQVGGKAEPLFVLAKDVITNHLYVGQSADHPGLNRKALFMREDEVHWIREDLAMEMGTQQSSWSFRFRYRQPLQQGNITRSEDGYYIEFDLPQAGIAAGQFAAWYDGGECIGSGVISD